MSDQYTRPVEQSLSIPIAIYKIQAQKETNVKKSNFRENAGVYKQHQCVCVRGRCLHLT